MKLPLPKEYYKISDVVFNGHKIRTYRFGIGKKKILSLPGFPHSGLIYLYFLFKYDLKKVQFITLDIPGWIGNSENIFDNGNYDEDKVLEIIDKVIEKYDLNEFSLIGYSFGASLAARIISNKKYKIEKAALVSPVLHGSKITDRRWLLNVINSLKIYSYLKVHVNHRFRYYKARLKLMGVDTGVLLEYFRLIKKSDSKVLLESLNKLFTTDYFEYLKDFDQSKILIASSKDEAELFRDQADRLKDYLDGEKSIYMHGSHEDFIVEPEKESVKKIMEFLIS